MFKSLVNFQLIFGMDEISCIHSSVNEYAICSAMCIGKAVNFLVFGTSSFAEDQLVLGYVLGFLFCFLIYVTIFITQNMLLLYLLSTL